MFEFLFIFDQRLQYHYTKEYIFQQLIILIFTSIIATQNMGNQSSCKDCLQDFDILGQTDNQTLLEANKEIIKWKEILTELKKQFSCLKQTENLVSKKCWQTLLTKFQKYSLTKDQKLQFLQSIKEFLSVNFGTKNINSQYEYCAQMGKKFNQLQTRIYFKHKYCLQNLKFVIRNKSSAKISEKFYSVYFPQLIFNLTVEETDKVATIIRMFCQNDMNSIAFLTLYFKISLNNRIKEQNFSKLQQNYLQILKYLEEKYPASKSEIKQVSDDPLKNIPFSEKVQIFEFKKSKTSHLDQLKQFIISKAQNAKKDQPLFRQLIKNDCYQYGYGLKTGVKIKGKQNNSSIFRTIQKLLDKPKFDHHFEQLKQKLVKKTQKLEKQKNLKLQNFVNEQQEQVKNKIMQILESQTEIQFDAKDLVRGKCTFNKKEQIIETVANLSKTIQQKGLKILQLKNRLNKNTKDVTLIICLPNSIAQLQLVLKLDSVSNQFNHKIYQLKRSKLYTPITNVFVHNDRWCQTFYTQQIQIFDQISLLNPSLNLQENIKFAELNQDITKFKKQYLKSNKIKFLKSPQQKQYEISKIQQKFKQILKIKQAENRKIPSTLRQFMQKQNQIHFYFNNVEYDLALQTINTVPPIQLERGLNVLRLKATILYMKQQFNESLKIYEKIIENYKIMNKVNDQSYAGTLNQIAFIYRGQGVITKAIEIREKALQIYLKLVGKQNQFTAYLMTSLGQDYRLKGDLKQAIELQQQAFKIKQKLFKDQSIDIAMSLNNMGMIYKSKKQFSKALQYLEKALYIRQKLEGKQSSIDIGTYIANIGSVYQQMTQYSKALEYYIKYYQIYQKIFGSQSIKTASPYRNIGLIYIKTGQYNKGLQFLTKSLRIRQKYATTSQNRFNLITILNDIGDYYKSQKQYKKAESYYLRAFNITKSNQSRQQQKAGQNNENHIMTNHLQTSPLTLQANLSKHDFSTDIQQQITKLIDFYQQSNNLTQRTNFIKQQHQYCLTHFGEQHQTTKKIQKSIK